MNALNVSKLTKRYPSFLLDGVSFSVKEGHVCGLIGANGAGKTTTLKGVTGLIPTEGAVEICGESLKENERAAKRKIGYVGGGFRFYPQKTVGAVARATAGFYPEWNEKRFCGFLNKYAIAPDKKITALSDGMKVKFFLSLALSHGARLLILDEPTSGLDPLSREEFCDTVRELVAQEGVSVLFSTHITSDLTQIADDAVFLSRGKILADEPLNALLGAYSFAVFADRESAARAGALGIKPVREGFGGLVRKGTAPSGAAVREASLDEIMVHLETEERNK